MSNEPTLPIELQVNDIYADVKEIEDELLTLPTDTLDDQERYINRLVRQRERSEQIPLLFKLREDFCKAYWGIE